jgi:hypothetical protein
MTQEELKLVLDALKFCHGGEPCGTAEAIAVVEKALANVATNDTPKERVDEIQKQRHEVNVQKFLGAPQPEQEEYLSKAYRLANELRCHLAIAPAPQRTWVGLTNNDLQPIAEEYRILFGSWVHDFARAIEAKLKEKNT